MRTTAILNLKGGVGKTTTAINLATMLAVNHGKRVLLVDADAQHNTSDFFSPEGGYRGTLTLTDYLKGHTLGTPAQAYRSRYTFRGLVDIIPSDDGLMDLDITTAGSGKVDLNCIKDFGVLCGANAETDYDYMIIDCPPAFSAATAAALIAADDVIIPMKLDAFAISGMANLTQQVVNMRRINPRLKICGILPTMWYNSFALRDAYKMLVDSGLPVFSPIRRSNTVDSSTFSQEPLIEARNRSSAKQDYMCLAKQYIEDARQAQNGKEVQVNGI